MNNTIIEYCDGTQTLIGELIFDSHVSKKTTSIILFPAFEGRSHFTSEYAQKLAKHGFITFIADMYGDAKNAKTIEECFTLITPFLQDRNLVRRRTLLAYETLKKQPSINQNNIGAVGFCFGGMCVLELARSGVNLHAGVSMHGVLGKSNLPTHAIKSKLLILHGYEDPQSPPDILDKFSEEMQQANVNDWTFVFFGKAKHSFTDPRTGSFNAAKEKEMGREYNKIAAERSFHYCLNFF
jgi:dienelactone hydrolase